MAEPDAVLETDAAALYRDHHGWLVTLLRRKLGNQENAADLAQDTFVRVLRQRQPGSLREPRAYLTVVARTLLTDFWRRRAIEQAYLEALAQQPEASAPSPEVRLQVLQTVARLDALLAALSPRAHRVFLLVQIDGLSLPEVARRVGVSLATVERDLASALRQCYVLRYAA